MTENQIEQAMRMQSVTRSILKGRSEGETAYIAGCTVAEVQETVQLLFYYDYATIQSSKVKLTKRGRKAFMKLESKLMEDAA